jgi:hypothetical protein
MLELQEGFAAMHQSAARPKPDGQYWVRKMTGLALPSAHGPLSRSRPVKSDVFHGVSVVIVLCRSYPAYAARVKSVSFDVDYWQYVLASCIRDYES